MNSLHICITSVLFDKKPEGVCTGRLIRSLLGQGHKVSLLTSSKEGSVLEHPNLSKVVYPHRPRYPRAAFKLLAKLEGGIASNFYMWTKRAAGHDFGDDVPDVFYGRAWPHASLVPAYQLAKRYKRPLILHFSDPFPAPNEELIFDIPFFSDLQMMVDAANALTFTNSETISYQGSYLDFDISRAHVLNHVAPDPLILGAPGERGGFYHVGSVGTSRPIDSLLDGFSLHVRDHPESRLYFVGANKKYVEPRIEERGLCSSVSVLPFVDNVREIFKRADVLISLDASIASPIFTPTKIIEYLVTDRPVLAITPMGSPVSKLVEKSPGTALAVTSYSPQDIADGMTRVLRLPWDRDAYEARLAVMSDFSSAAVAAQFEKIISGM